MAKVEKTFSIKKTRYSRNPSTPLVLTGTLGELIKKCAYTLECGASYSYEKGRSKINCQPKTIKSLITNLNNAVNNSAANGYAGVTYTLVEQE
jgi:hypothetical protein